MKQRVIAGIWLSGLIGGLARWRGMLSTGGVVGSMLIGTIVFSVGGLAWSIVVVAFFVSSSVLSRVSSERKRRVAADKFSKPGARDLFQTIANGGVGTCAALAYGILRQRKPGWLHAAFVGAFATATADTWATEVGTLARSRPRLITTGKLVPPGTSGGVTWLGTSAALAGGLMLGLTAALTARTISKDAPSSGSGLVAAGLSGGLFGVLVDSLLGATVQQVYFCPRCQSETERTIHMCGMQTTPLRGWGWMDNDTVNLLSTVGGATVGGARTGCCREQQCLRAVAEASRESRSVKTPASPRCLSKMVHAPCVNGGGRDALPAQRYYQGPALHGRHTRHTRA